MVKRILLIAGYGGHAGYVYAVAYELARSGFTENVVLIAQGYEFLAARFCDLGEIHYQVLPRKPGESLQRGLGKWIKAFLQSTKISLSYDISVVFAGGSNFSIPPSITTKFLRRPMLYTLEAIEHFTKPSRAVKVLEKMGAVVFLHWNEQLEIFPKGVVVGPVYEPALYESRDEGYVLVTTGTLGFKELFDIVEWLGIENVVLQTGDVDPEPYIKKNPSWRVFRYTSDIHKWIAGASLVITQQGVTASTASLAYGKPVIIVYNPRVVLGAPRRDVEIYAEKLGAEYVEKPTRELLKKAIEKASKPTKTYPKGAEEIAKILLNTLKHKT